MTKEQIRLLIQTSSQLRCPVDVSSEVTDIFLYKVAKLIASDEYDKVNRAVDKLMLFYYPAVYNINEVIHNANKHLVPEFCDIDVNKIDNILREIYNVNSDIKPEQRLQVTKQNLLELYDNYIKAYVDKYTIENDVNRINDIIVSHFIDISDYIDRKSYTNTKTMLNTQLSGLENTNVATTYILLKDKFKFFINYSFNYYYKLLVVIMNNKLSANEYYHIEQVLAVYTNELDIVDALKERFNNNVFYDNVTEEEVIDALWPMLLEI